MTKKKETFDQKMDRFSKGCFKFAFAVIKFQLGLIFTVIVVGFLWLLFGNL